MCDTLCDRPVTNDGRSSGDFGLGEKEDHVRTLVEIHERLPDGKERVTPAEFISADILTRLGGYKAPDSLRQKLWRLEHPERVTEHKRAFQERQRQRKEGG
jgi:hypothetical protein